MTQAMGIKGTLTVMSAASCKELNPYIVHLNLI